jgi:hypothetical protein
MRLDAVGLAILWMRHAFELKISRSFRFVDRPTENDQPLTKEDNHACQARNRSDDLDRRLILRWRVGAT